MLITIPDFDPEVIRDSGQCFRMFRDGGVFSLTAHRRLLRIKPRDGGKFDFDCDTSEFDALWRGYFDLDFDYAAALPPNADEYLLRAARFSRGMKILRQDPWETLVSFIISQRRSIPSIRTGVAKLCEKYGDQIDGGFAFPDQGKLISDRPLDCSLGYRDEYVRAAALADISGWDALPDEKLTRNLLELRGVGVKVATCVRLFGYHRLGAFPVDVWISRVLADIYGGEVPDFGQYAGVCQQYLFYYIRKGR